MKSFDYIRMELQEDTYEFYGNYHFVSAKNAQNIVYRVNKIIDNIKKQMSNENKTTKETSERSEKES